MFHLSGFYFLQIYKFSNTFDEKYLLQRLHHCKTQWMGIPLLLFQILVHWIPSNFYYYYNMPLRKLQFSETSYLFYLVEGNLVMKLALDCIHLCAHCFNESYNNIHSIIMFIYFWCDYFNVSHGFSPIMLGILERNHGGFLLEVKTAATKQATGWSENG